MTLIPPHRVIGARLKAVREAYGWRICDAAHILGISPQRYGMYEKGHREMRSFMLALVCNGWKVNAEYLLLGTGPMLRSMPAMRQFPKPPRGNYPKTTPRHR